MHCALNEKKYNPYYSFLMQKFCEYDRRFKMTLQFHTWDKFKLLTSMKKEQISNLANLVNNVVVTDCMSLSILKVLKIISDECYTCLQRTVSFLELSD